MYTKAICPFCALALSHEAIRDRSTATRQSFPEFLTEPRRFKRNKTESSIHFWKETKKKLLSGNMIVFMYSRWES